VAFFCWGAFFFTEYIYTTIAIAIAIVMASLAERGEGDMGIARDRVRDG
jgi:hypothetical protein